MCFKEGTKGKMVNTSYIRHNSRKYSIPEKNGLGRAAIFPIKSSFEFSEFSECPTATRKILIKEILALFLFSTGFECRFCFLSKSKSIRIDTG